MLGVENQSARHGFWGDIHPIMAIGSAFLVVALHFSFVLIFATYGLCKSLYNEGKTLNNINRPLITFSTTETEE